VPFTLPALAPLASRFPIAAATSATVALSGPSRGDPSGRCTFIGHLAQNHNRAAPALRGDLRLGISTDDQRQGDELVLVVRVCWVGVVLRDIKASRSIGRAAGAVFPRLGSFTGPCRTGRP